MTPTLWQRLRPTTSGPAPEDTGGTTGMREVHGSNAGAVLFQSYAVAGPEPNGPVDDGPEVPASGNAALSDGAPADADGADGQRIANPLAVAWRQANPDVFRTMAQRFCVRAPDVVRELGEHCRSGEHARLSRLAASLKPSLGLYDTTAANAAERVERVASRGPLADVPRAVTVLEEEVCRVAAAWQDGDA